MHFASVQKPCMAAFVAAAMFIRFTLHGVPFEKSNLHTSDVPCGAA
jgi:hypothetical protein